MAKSAEKTQEQIFEEMKALLTPEELEQLMKLTWQDNGGGGIKTPILKINYKERADKNGKKIAKGNFVLGQASGVVDGKKVLVEAGVDLGNKLNVVILKTGSQYSYWCEDVKSRCSSQIITERGEIPRGFNLKNVCSDGSCPRRKAGVEKGDRCINQMIAYVRLPAGTKLPDGTDCPIAMLYVKGMSYKPLQDYINSDLKGIPTIAVTTELSTSEEEQGATVFYVLQLKKGATVPTEVFKQNYELVAGVNSQLLDYKKEQAKKLIESKSGEVISKDEVVDAKLVNAPNPDSDIDW